MCIPFSFHGIVLIKENFSFILVRVINIFQDIIKVSNKNMEDFIYVVVNELYDIVRQEINSATRYKFGWNKLDYIVDYSLEKIYKTKPSKGITHYEDYASVMVYKNEQTGSYDLRVSLYLLNHFVGPHGLGLREIYPIIINLANYGIENMRESIEEKIENIPFSTEEYIRTSPIRINMNLSQLDEKYEKLYEFNFYEKWFVPNVILNLSFIDEKDFAPGGEMVNKARDRFSMMQNKGY